MLKKVQGATRLGPRGNRTESLWEEILPLRGSLRGPLKTSQKSLKTSQKPLKTSQNLWKPLKKLWKPSLSETLSETLSEADFLSDALSPVAPILLPLKVSTIMGCFPVDFQEVKRPRRAKSGKRPIKVGKRPIKEVKRPIKAMVAGCHFSRLLNGLFSGTPAMVEKRPL